MKEHIEREAFLEQKRKQYCEDCSRRKGMKNGKYKTLYEIGEAPCRACEIDDVLNDVEDFPAADVRPVEWIPVTERLPEDDGFTLIFTEHGNPGVCYFTCGWWGGYDKDGITHWMPIPEPPKEET